MSMEFSAEDFINGGMGVKSTTSYTVKSSEGYDGFADNLSMEMYRAEQELQSLEAFEMLSDVNASQKIKMVKRIANNYVGGIQNSVASNSIESVCLAQIKSLEDAAAAPAGDTKTEEKPATEGQKKKLGFMKTVFGAIAKFFKTIWKWITESIKWFGTKIKNLFTKKAKEAPKTDEASDLTNNDGAKATTAAGSATSNDAKLDKAIDKAKMVFNLTTSFNPTGANEFSKNYTNLAKSVSDIWKGYEKALGSKTATADVNHADNVTFTGSIKNKIYNETQVIIKSFGVKTTNLGIAATDNAKNVKKYMEDVTKALRAAFNKNDDVARIVEALFGFKKMSHEEFVKIVKSNSNADINKRGAAVSNLTNMGGKLTDYYNAFITKLENPHRELTTITDEIQKKLDNRLADDNKTTNSTTQNMAIMQAMLKTCCTLEQSIGKVVSNINSNMMYQINLMK